VPALNFDRWQVLNHPRYLCITLGSKFKNVSFFQVLATFYPNLRKMYKYLTLCFINKKKFYAIQIPEFTYFFYFENQ
jgi:hypothetical protein